MPLRFASRTRLLLSSASLAASLLLGGCETGSLRDIGVPLSDESPISDRVRAALEDSPETMNSNILVKSLGEGRVRLSGLVNTPALGHTAELIARSVPGVAGVVNTLMVR